MSCLFQDHKLIAITISDLYPNVKNHKVCVLLLSQSAFSCFNLWHASLQSTESAAYTAFMTEVSKQTPMMKQYWRFKVEAPDAILFFHLVDFYETFFEDADLR